jgi:diguanylate cyclase (GGDEF)-like protein
MGLNSTHRSTSSLARFWHWLTDPSDALQETELRRRARLLSTLLVATLALGMIAVILTILDISSNPGAGQGGLLMIPLYAVLFLAGVYLLSRTRHYHAAAITTVCIFLISTFLAFIFNPAQSISLAFLILGGLISSLFLSTRATVLVFIITMSAISQLPQLVPSMTNLMLVTSMFFTFSVGVVVVVATSIRESDLARINLQAAALTEREGSLSAALLAADQANERLRLSVQALEQNNQDAALMAEMGNLLNLCARMTETYNVITNSARQLFPFQAGALYILSESRNDLESVTAWSGPEGGPLMEISLAPDECWALRRGHLHRVEPAHPNILCRHLPNPPPTGYMCVPMMSQGEVFGVFHIRSTVNFPVASLNEGLAAGAAEQIALALTNLKLRESLRNQSIRDPLTGLFNQRYMIETFGRELSRAERNGQPLGVAMLDVDHFKQFNDTFGHEAGDLIMRHLGSIIRSSIRTSDIACRYGGEEFTLIMPDAPLKIVQERLDLLRLTIKQLNLQNRGRPLGLVTLSGGISIFPQHGKSPDELLRAADQALYRAKAEGRDRIVIAG